MTATAERVLREIRQLPPAERNEIWEELRHLVLDLSAPSATDLPQVSNEEFEAALEEVTGCTSGSGSLERLLQDRQRDRDREQSLLQSRAKDQGRG